MYLKDSRNDNSLMFFNSVNLSPWPIISGLFSSLAQATVAMFLLLQDHACSQTLQLSLPQLVKTSYF